MIVIACIACSKPLSADEAEYYGFLCEACERAHEARLVAWLNGGPDPQFDVVRAIADRLS